MSIKAALALLKSIRAKGVTEIICGVSGGKDSLATLDLCARVFDRVHGFFLFLIPGLESEEKHLSAAEKRCGIALHRLRHPAMSNYLRFSQLRECRPETEDAIRRNLRWDDIERVMRSRTGAKWFAYGHRIMDSLHRRGMLLTAKGVLEKQQRCYPLWDWSHTDVFSYLRANKIPIPSMFGVKTHKTSGLCPDDVKCLLELRQHYPSDYAKIIAVFPHAEHLIERSELREKYGITAKNSGYLDDAPTAEATAG